MTTTAQTGQLTEIAQALTNRKAITTLLISFLSAFFILFLGVLTKSGWGVALFGFIALIIFNLGVFGAGIQFMDQAQQHHVRGTFTALLAAPIALVKFIGVCLIILGIFLAAIVVIALLLLVCKIPYIGTALLVLVIPASVLTFSLFVATSYITYTICAPAAWQGKGFKEVLSTLFAVVSQRAWATALDLIVVTLLTGILSGLLFFILFSGTSITTGLAVSILGSEAGLGFGGGLLGSAMQLVTGSGFDLNGKLVAIAISGAILILLYVAIIASIALFGACMILLRAQAQIDVTQASDAINQKLEEAKRKGTELAEKAKAASAAQAPVQKTLAPMAPAPAAQARSAAVALHCPKCSAPITPEDTFCGDCGHKLQ
jgi:hypothetical protein